MCGVIPLHVRIGYLYLRVWLGVVEKIEFKVLLGTKFIDKFVKSILPHEGRIIPINSTVVPILGSGFDHDLAEMGKKDIEEYLSGESCERPTDCTIHSRKSTIKV